jgi:hypothetical protein
MAGMSIKDIQRRRWPEWIKRFVLVVVSACLAFLSAELLVRYMVPDWPFGNPPYIADYLSARDAPLRWKYSSRAGRNSLGLRNREVTAKKPGTLRILFVGDSLVWSGETSSGDLYTSVLERRLNGRSVNKMHFEVINAGVPGYTTYQELEFLKIYGLDMEPDLVVLGFVFNDVYYKYFHRPNRKGYLALSQRRIFIISTPILFPGSFWPEATWRMKL